MSAKKIESFYSVKGSDFTGGAPRCALLASGSTPVSSVAAAAD